MPGPAPKTDKQRRNKKATTAELVANPDAEVPALPAFPPIPQRKDYNTGELLPPEPWDPMVRELWNDIWTGPTGSQYTKADQHGLLMYAVLHQRLWSADDIETFKVLAGEIRLQSRRFGLDPMARANLNWTVAEGKGAVEKQNEREQKREAARERRRQQVKAQQDSLPQLTAGGEEIVDAEVVPDPLAEQELSALEG